MARHGVKKLIYSSTCATYGEPEKMPITEATSQVTLYGLVFYRTDVACIFFELFVLNKSSVEILGTHQPLWEG